MIYQTKLNRFSSVMQSFEYDQLSCKINFLRYLNTTLRDKNHPYFDKVTFSDMETVRDAIEQQINTVFLFYELKK